MKNVLRWTWRVAICLFVIVVSLVAFHTAQTPFQTAVISGLALIFVYANSRQRATIAIMVHHNKAGFARFILLLGALNSPKTDEYTNAGKKELATDDDLINSWWLYILTDSLISLVALYKLIAVMV